MSAAQHTPGPWAFNADSGDISAHGGLIAETYNSDYTLLQDDRNGRLIAAAPELLAALKRLVEWNGKRGFSSPEAPDELLPADEQSIEVSEGMAAIAKAEGRS